MTIFTAADEMHRLAKRAMDSGAAQSRAEAEAMLLGYRIGVSVGSDQVRDPGHQAALLTAVALGRRVFLGGVIVSGSLDVPLSTPLPFGATLREAVIALGGTVAESAIAGIPLITIGGPAGLKTEGFHVRAVFDGWRGGIVPGHADGFAAGTRAMPLAPMLAAALAVNETFLHVSGEMPAAGKRVAGLSLWDLAPGADWLASGSEGPELKYLPTQLWLIGLGHLGQAYLWGLGLLPYGDPAALNLVLQDTDIITPSTESTSILTDGTMLGAQKTRLMAAWAERRGFATVITERLFGGHGSRLPSEPGVALCGIDNAAGRRAFDQAGFDFVVEAGLGRGHQDFRTLLLHTLPGKHSASEIWAADDSHGHTPEQAAAYRKMLSEGSLDQCGVTLLAGKAVGAPFVGAVAATLVLSEVLRLLHGGKIHRLIDMNLVDLDHYSALPQVHDFSALNPGFVMAGLHLDNAPGCGP